MRLKSGEQLPAQLVILGVGVRAENKLAVDAGLEMGPAAGSASTTTCLRATPTSMPWATRSRLWTSFPASPHRSRWPVRRIGKAALPPTISSVVPAVIAVRRERPSWAFSSYGRHDRRIGKISAAGQAAVPQDLHSSGPSCRLLSRRGGDGPETAVPSARPAESSARRRWAAQASINGSTCSPWRSRRT